ncbi:possible alpha-ribazole-5'-P phosphatase [Prochlorococcus marinus str. MIT 9515]|uniref:Possible alpha-ribazole-5'-P phosphatase n=1 Tax=Prochlorococcus marinus (strain MIT 9515) TaxID=167542 RepID=A2BVH7_PROM5|nr:histidine phosphatase family protein [Prochlorococcus marinus]ABM71788.1 possible alpha-ribazole-5'-P phosphatase [Prochlorococcus marinus str. MIT 9515]
MSVRLVLVRHGLSSFNEKGLIQGRTDESYLTDKGYEQALKSGEALSDINFNKIYSSPLSRAAETAKTIKKNLKGENNIIYDENLLEVDLSKWSGLTINEIKNKYPEKYLLWKTDPENLKLDGNDNLPYQPIQELYSQANEFIKNILNIYLEKNEVNILVVGHNAILRCLILSLIGRPQKGFRKLKLDNASFSILNILKFRNSFKTQIECLNQTSHLNKKIPDQIGDSRIFLVRHGETNWNKEGRFQGQINIPLNDNGKDQAKKASTYLKEVNFNKAFSSSMDRPYETAQIILQNKSDIEIKKIKKLVEISHGLWEGKLENEIKEQWPELLKSWHEKPEEVTMPKGESIREVSERSIKAWEEICLNQKKYDLTLLVAHDAVNKTLICNLLGIDYSNIWMIKQGNGGITIIDLFNDPQKDHVISALNITTHLGGILDSTASGAL